jgi:hypothetical protein
MVLICASSNAPSANNTVGSNGVAVASALLLDGFMDALTAFAPGLITDLPSTAIAERRHALDEKYPTLF